MAVDVIKQPEQRVRDTLAALGRGVAGPWRAEQKLAALGLARAGGEGGRGRTREQWFETEEQKQTIRELPAGVWEISKLTDVDRHSPSQHWRQLATAYEPKQFHVSRNGLALLVAYVLHLLDGFHATIRKVAAHHRVASPRAARGVGGRLSRRAPTGTVTGNRATRFVVATSLPVIRMIGPFQAVHAANGRRRSHP